MDFQELGKRWMMEEIDIDGWTIMENGKPLKHYDFSENEKQMEFLNDREHQDLMYVGGMGAGKTLPTLVKSLYIVLMFPGAQVLLGRDTVKEVRKVLIEGKDGIINLLNEDLDKNNRGQLIHRWDKDQDTIQFVNNSVIHYIGLEGGKSDDLIKAQKKIRGYSLDFVAIDQAETLSEEIFHLLGSRMRGTAIPRLNKNGEKVEIDGNPQYWRQITMNMNPFGNWLYDYFHEDDDTRHYIEASMLDNRKYLGEDFIQRAMKNPEEWKKRHVFGHWTPGDEGNIFYEEWLEAQPVDEPKRRWEDISVWETPKDGHSYVIGFDSTEGVEDYAVAVVVDEVTGEQVAQWRDRTPVHVQAQKLLQIARRYNKALIIPEANSSGLAVIESIKDDYRNIYRRDKSYGKDKPKDVSSDLGFRTTRTSKHHLISHMQELFRDGVPTIRDKKTVEEMRYYRWTDEARKQGAGAPDGKHDDTVIATMLAYLPIEKILNDRKKNILKSIIDEKVTKKKYNFQYN